MEFIDLSKYDIIKKEKGAVIAKYKGGSNDLLFMSDTQLKTEFYEYKRMEKEDAVVRIMPSYDGCAIQFRGNQPLGENGRYSGTKPRNLAAIAHLSLEDLEYIVAYLKSLKNNP